MRRIVTRLGAAAWMGLAPLAMQSVQAQDPDPIAIEGAAPSQFQPGEIVVQFRPGTSEETRNQILAMVDGVYAGSLDLADAVIAKVPVGTERAAADSLGVDPNVLSAAPNAFLPAAAAAE